VNSRTETNKHWNHVGGSVLSTVSRRQTKPWGRKSGPEALTLKKKSIFDWGGETQVEILKDCIWFGGRQKRIEKETPSKQGRETKTWAFPNETNISIFEEKHTAQPRERNRMEHY